MRLFVDMLCRRLRLQAEECRAMLETANDAGLSAHEALRLLALLLHLRDGEAPGPDAAAELRRRLDALQQTDGDRTHGSGYWRLWSAMIELEAQLAAILDPGDDMFTLFDDAIARASHR